MKHPRNHGQGLFCCQKPAGFNQQKLGYLRKGLFEASKTEKIEDSQYNSVDSFLQDQNCLPRISGHIQTARVVVWITWRHVKYHNMKLIWKMHLGAPWILIVTSARIQVEDVEFGSNNLGPQQWPVHSRNAECHQEVPVRAKENPCTFPRSQVDGRGGAYGKPWAFKLSPSASGGTWQW